MMIARIFDLDDPRLKPFREIKMERREWNQRYFLAEGWLLWERLIECGWEIEAVVTIERLAEAVVRTAPDDCRIYIVPDEALSALVGFKFHRGIIAQGCRRARQVSCESLAAPGPAVVVVCPQIQDPENLGSILRVSAAFGARGLVVGAGCPDPFTRRVLRVSMGAVLRLPVWHEVDPAMWLRDACHGYEFSAVATVLDPAAPQLAEFVWPARTALVLGREDQGLTLEIRSACSREVTIPMAAGTDSLNVAVAAGIFLHHRSVVFPNLMI